MTKADLVNQIAAQTGLDKTSVLAVVEALMKDIKGSIVKRENVYLRGFGTFQTKVRKEKVARNISKNTTIVVPEHAIPSFKPSKEFIKAVK